MHLFNMSSMLKLSMQLPI